MLRKIANDDHIAIKELSNIPNHQISFANILLGIVFNRKKVKKVSHWALNQRLKIAIEHLMVQNHPTIDNTLSIIYDLEELAHDAPQHHWKIMKTLTTFVRNHTLDAPQQKINSTTISTVIQAALTVIGRRNTNLDPENEQLDLSHTDMRGVNLHKANLELTNLYQVNFSGANLSDANLSGVILSAANLSGSNLSGTNLSGAILSAANLSGANLSGANLSMANLYLANLHEAILSDVILNGANLRDAKLSVTETIGAQQSNV
jgi:uncharacterized protein YjbI with pentapeptide repeats